jgi:hypothetical protein
LRTSKDGSERRTAEVCGDNPSQLTDWPIKRISEVVEPTDAQRSVLDELRVASAKAIVMLKSDCPKDLPSVPTGRKLKAPDSGWDLIVCDEAHKMSARAFGGEITYTKRYKLGQLPR